MESPEKCVTVHSGIDLRRFSIPFDKSKIRREFNLPETAWLIGNTSALADHKDYFTFLDTARLIVDQGLYCRFIIMGEGDMKAELQSYTRKLELENHIVFTGFRHDLPELLPGLDVFLITSKTEGLGTSILDAWACKVPVVATEAGGIPEMVEHEITGLLSPVKDSSSLASHVIKYVKNPNLTREISESAYLKLHKFFTKKQTAEKTLEVYQEIMRI